MDLDDQTVRKRGGFGNEVYEKEDMQRRVRELFWGLSMGRVAVEGASGQHATKDAESGGSVAVGAVKPDSHGGVEVRFRQEEEDLHVVDASGSVEEVAEEIWKVVKPRVEAVERGEVGRVIRRVS
jgi:dTMP kinase